MPQPSPPLPPVYSHLKSRERLYNFVLMKTKQVVLANVDVKERTGGLTSLVLDKCWR